MEVKRKDEVTIQNNNNKKWVVLEKTSTGICTLKLINSENPEEVKTVHISNII